MGGVKYASERSIAAVLAGVGVETLFDVAAVRQAVGSPNAAAMLRAVHFAALLLDEVEALRPAATGSLPMILHCPVCHMQHIDEIDEEANPGWMNPEHISHLCLGCGTVWRPCDRPTEGVRILERHGRRDTWPVRGRNPLNSSEDGGMLAALAAPLQVAADQERERAAQVSEEKRPAGKEAPPNCRDRLRMERKAYPRSGCAGCSPKNKHKFACPYLGEK